MGYQLGDLAHAVAVVRAGLDSDGDSEPQGLRLRVASLFWVTSLGVAYAVGALFRSLTVAIAVLGVAFVAMVVIAVGPRRALASIRKRRT